jgi:hypothetical protein
MAEPTNITPLQTGAGLNLNINPRSHRPGSLTYCLNGVLEGIDGQGYSMQDELGNKICAILPSGYKVIGRKAIIEQDLMLFWMVNPPTGESEIGQVKDCTYTKLINSSCLNLDINDPIHKVFYRIVDCGTEVYWRDRNGRRFLNINDLPYKEIPNPNGCGLIKTDEIDCNKLLVQPNFSIPDIEVVETRSEGDIIAGTYQFAISYSSRNSENYTSYYSVTNPLPIFDESKVTLEFNYSVNKSIHLSITGIDTTGLYEYLSLAVIKTVNNISSFELVGTYLIEESSKNIVYTGQKIKNLTEADIFEKFPVYTKADDIYAVQGVIGWQGLTLQERVSYQEIANNIDLKWQSWRLKAGAYKDPVHAAKHKGYWRDEVYPLEFVPLLKNGFQCDGFTIQGRKANTYDLEVISGPDVLPDGNTECSVVEEGKPRWKVYNTATKIGYAPEYNPANECYEGPFEYGEMAYWESTDEYTCGEGLTGTIRHHRFPDEKISPRYSSGEGGDYIYALGIRIDVQQVLEAIKNSSLTQEQKDNIAGFKIVRGNRAGGQKSVLFKGLLNNVGKYTYEGTDYFFPNYGEGNDLGTDPFIGNSQTGDDELWQLTFLKRLKPFTSEDSKQRFTLHSPDPHFFRPEVNTGDTLKLETVEEGTSEGHFVPVKNHAKYAFLSTASYLTALGIGAGALLVGAGLDGLESNAMVTAFTTTIDIIGKIIPRVNYAYQYDGVGKYTTSTPIDNNGNKQRRLNLAFYLEPGMVKRGETLTINNFQRESSVYLRTDSVLPFSHEQHGTVDDSKWILSGENSCGKPATIKQKHINTYYAAVKRNMPNQWGQLYSYETIDTGFQWTGDIYKNLQSSDRYQTIFGGDAFIGRMGLKRKLPFFLDHRVGFPDNSDVFYNEIPNVGHPLYWLSTDAVEAKGIGNFQNPFQSAVKAIFGVKANNFDCRTDGFFYQKGKFYLFHYGIPYFYCESEVNLDMRQAYNDREGEFYPHVGDGIPDEWLQETNTSIQQDNTYHYNKTYSKQNKENYFSHLPKDYDPNCDVYNPHLTIYSDKGNWRIYRAISKFEFPKDKGTITSIDAISNGAVMVRYEDSFQIYNALLTINTSSPQAAYLGNDTLFKSAPPMEFQAVEGGYAGSQHKMLVHTPYGSVFTDAKRGDVFLLEGNSPKPISTPEVAAFLQQYLFVNGDNHFNGKGITGVWDKANERILLTKLDGAKSFTLSYNFQAQAWMSLHSYIPNFYVEEPQNFYSSEQNGLWIHGTDPTNYHSFYGRNYDYVIEYPLSYQYNDEVFHSVKDYSQVIKYNTDGTFVYTDDWFTSAILTNDTQSSGVRKLSPKPKKSLKELAAFPKYNSDSIDIVYSKSNSFYNFNTVWDALKDNSQPVWKPSQINLSIYRELNQDNHNYKKNSKKFPMMAKNLKIRLINSRTDRRIISNFLTTESQPLY